MAYSGTPTIYGEQQIAAAFANGTRLPVVTIAVGDGGGTAVVPSEGQTGLTHEVWRGAITSWGVDPADTRRIVVHTTVPATAGPFVVREAGVYDSSGGLICVTALAATEVVGPGTSNQLTSIDLTIAMPIGSAGAITVSPTQGERFTIERLYRTPFISVNSASVAAPPASPALGDLYIVPAGATGAWANAGTGTLAEWNGVFWAFLAPPLKMVAGLMDQGDDTAAEYLKWNGTAWEVFAAAGVIFTVTDTAGASTPDEFVGTASPSLAALQPNMIFRFRQGTQANTTTTPHGNVDGYGDKPFTKADGSLLAIGDLPAKVDFLAEYDGAGLRVFGSRPSDHIALIEANGAAVAQSIPSQIDGCTRLTRTSATTITLNSQDGIYIIVNGQPQVIPAAGVPISNAGLAVNSWYFAYLYMSASTLTLELSTTGYVANSKNQMVKSGDATRRLVGAIGTDSNGNFQDNFTQRFVANYFNRRTKQLAGNVGTGAIGSSSPVEISVAARVAGWCWNDEGALAIVLGSGSGVAGSPFAVAVGIDGVALGNSPGTVSPSTGQNTIVIGKTSTNLSEGGHVFSPMASSSGGNTATISANITVELEI